jgi:hypothetical protein
MLSATSALLGSRPMLPAAPHSFTAGNTPCLTKRARTAGKFTRPCLTKGSQRGLVIIMCFAGFWFAAGTCSGQWRIRRAERKAVHAAERGTGAERQRRLYRPPS